GATVAGAPAATVARRRRLAAAVGLPRVTLRGWRCNRLPYAPLPHSAARGGAGYRGRTRTRSARRPWTRAVRLEGAASQTSNVVDGAGGRRGSHRADLSARV